MTILRATVRTASDDDALLLVDALAAELTRRGARDVTVGVSQRRVDHVDVELVAADHIEAVRLLEAARTAC